MHVVCDRKFDRKLHLTVNLSVFMIAMLKNQQILSSSYTLYTEQPNHKIHNWVKMENDLLSLTVWYTSFGLLARNSLSIVESPAAAAVATVSGSNL